ncbi:PilD-dependent protein PddD [Legionella massiliensis]|uniref:Type II secretion system protein J n=1 Tax=Legionella massiliensis TaxID=1034943 RepID=A0A078KZF3_9GAMM|nr:GspJ family T2SS minor pseudopilin variant LspJ [Legionella massiliensis]CDZ78397.1 PilD-dependent protein PddD [Legionella massiliensis]CEE14135.1 Type II secretion system protein J precursor [Legionella massiliensis]
MKKIAGFTLLEILIALAVFAIIATITSSTLYQTFNTKTRLTEQTERLNSLQLALILLERDTQQIILRDVRNDESHVYPAFIGESQYFEFTRTGIANPGSINKQSILQRVAILCKGNKLVRRSWPTLDTTSRNSYEDKVLIDQISGCDFAYLNNNLQSLKEWHANAVQANQKVEPMPKAIQMNLKLEWGKLNYLFVIPGALYAG